MVDMDTTIGNISEDTTTSTNTAGRLAKGRGAPSCEGGIGLRGNSGYAGWCVVGAAGCDSWSYTTVCTLKIESSRFVRSQELPFIWWTASQLMAFLCRCKAFGLVIQSAQCMHLTA
jgi:hypothetical protein